MKLFEYEAKAFLQTCGIPVPKGKVCGTEDEAASAYTEFGGKAVLKAQVLAGGRGKAGGIKFPRSEAEARSMAKDILAMKIKGEAVEKMLVEEKQDIKNEHYLGIVTDPDAGCPLLMFCAEGGMDIEELSSKTPDAIKKAFIDPRYGLFGYQVQELLKGSDIPNDAKTSIVSIARALYQTYWDRDGELIEINPLVETTEGKVVAADAKFNIDNSALYRQPDMPKRPVRTVEERAEKLGLSYISLDGNIGIISNGAGLTMSAMDYLNQEGAKPANFLDLGGQATQSSGIKNGIGLVLEKPDVTALLIYIFAGGPRCDVIATGIVEAINDMEKEKSLRVPIVVTLHGRFADEGMKVLSTCKSQRLYQETTVEGAVHKVIELGGKAR